MSEERPHKSQWSTDPLGKPEDHIKHTTYVRISPALREHPILKKPIEALIKKNRMNPESAYVLIALTDADSGTGKNGILGPADMSKEEMDRFTKEPEEYIHGDTFDYLIEVPVEYLEPAPLN